METVANDTPGLLIVGHGTRDPAGLAEFHLTVEMIARRLAHVVVEGGFLEFAEPTIADAMALAARRGARRLTAAPLVLFAAGHAKRDIPAALAAAAQTLRLPAPHQLPHLGCQPPMIQLSLKRYEQAVAPLPHIADSQTLLLMVGRGSTHADANSELARFTRLRWEARPVGWHETCFAALTEPRLDRAMAMAAQLPFRRVVVQPHLLFQGELLRGIRHTVDTQARRWPEIDWVVAERLGPDDLLVEAAIEGSSEGSGFRVQGSAYENGPRDYGPGLVLVTNAQPKMPAQPENARTSMLNPEP